jgi:mannitol/fructose-specific phosphotransferase system IIA component (Ntr-type)
VDSLLDALQEGRLIELPDPNKEDALQFLAHVLEAIPSLPPGTDIAGIIRAKEQNTRTSLGNGWACPDARVPFEEDLICVVGWSPQGIAYGAPDGIPVRIVAMYLVPENQRSHYLREVSLLAKALAIYPKRDQIGAATELTEVRGHLLDLIATTRESVGPDVRARMIQLQARPAADAVAAMLPDLVVEPLTVVAAPGMRAVVLAQDRELMELLEKAAGFVDAVTARGAYHEGRWHIVKRGATLYPGDRVLYDCLALRRAGDGR